AVGAGDEARARSLAFHTVVIALALGLAVTVILFVFGRPIYSALGGHGEALEQALIYSNVVFLGALAIWLCNLLA
ncbi:MATE family efflux transporter, partial [Acinetobacter baumannii]|uniref:MATE family efflux transporter n=1 Tax=Acinetobacter baumannii TaxID=470 RepID=UPI0020907CB6